MERAQPQIVRQDPRCPFCHEAVRLEQPQLACNGCRAWHHQGCWKEGGQRCSACGGGATGLLQVGGAGTERSGPRERSAWRPSLALTLAGFVGAGLVIYLVVLAAPLLAALLSGHPLGLLAALAGLLGVSAPGLYGLWRWLYQDDAQPLRLPGPVGKRTPEQQTALAARFPSSVAAFRASGISLKPGASERLGGSRVLCMERADDIEALVRILEPFATDQAETPFVLAASGFSDEIVQMVEVNVNRGILPWVAVHATPGQLDELARVTRGKRVRAGQTPKVGHVGRAVTLNLGDDTLSLTGPGGEARISVTPPPERPPSPAKPAV